MKHDLFLLEYDLSTITSSAHTGSDDTRPLIQLRCFLLPRVRSETDATATGSGAVLLGCCGACCSELPASSGASTASVAAATASSPATAPAPAPAPAPAVARCAEIASSVAAASSS